MKSLVGQLVSVQWIDAGDLDIGSWCTTTEVDLAACEDRTTATSVGWLLVDDEKYVAMAASRIEERDGSFVYSQVHRIPRAWGMKITKL